MGAVVICNDANATSRTVLIDKFVQYYGDSHLHSATLNEVLSVVEGGDTKCRWELGSSTNGEKTLRATARVERTNLRKHNRKRVFTTSEGSDNSVHYEV